MSYARLSRGLKDQRRTVMDFGRIEGAKALHGPVMECLDREGSVPQPLQAGFFLACALPAFKRCVQADAP